MVNLLNNTFNYNILKINNVPAKCILAILHAMEQCLLVPRELYSIMGVNQDVESVHYLGVK